MKIFNKINTQLKKVILSAMILIANGSAFAQWSGPSNSTVGTLEHYSYTRSAPFTTVTWSVSKGYVENSWLSADRLTAYADVHWTLSGSATLTVKNNGSTVSTKAVSLSCGSMLPPTYVVQGNATACGPSAFQITATPGSPGGYVKWYTSMSDPFPFTDGTSYTTPILNATTTYYISTEYGGVVSLMESQPQQSSGASTLNAGECESTRVPVTLTITGPPPAPTNPIQEFAICGSGITQLDATAPGGYSLRWYASPTGGSVLWSGNLFETPSLSASTTYYASSWSAGIGCESTTRTPVVASISPIVGVPSAANTSRCGPGTATLSATAGANTQEIQWLTVNGVYLGSGSTYQPNVAAAATTFKVKGINHTTGCNSSTISVTVSVNPLPGNPTSMGSQINCPGPMTLTGTPGSGAIGINWYTAATGGSPIPVTQNVTSNTTFYGTSVSTAGCESPRVPKAANVYTAPAQPTYEFDSYACGTSGTALIFAHPPNGNNAKWYAVPTGGSSLTPNMPDGLSFTTPALSASTTYYITSLDPGNGCESSPRVAVPVILHQKPASPVILNAQRCGAGSVTLNASTSPGNTLYWVNNMDGSTSGAPSVTTPVNQSQTLTYSVYALSPYCVSPPVTATATILPAIPATTDPEAVASSFVHGHGRVTLISSFYSKWYDAPENGNLLGKGFSLNTDDLHSPVNFYHARYDSVTHCESPRVALTADIRPLISNGFVKTENIRISGVTQDNQIAALTDAEKSTVIEHYDGLLRSVQQTFVRGSVSGKDVVQPIEYDEFGRTPKQYLPYVAEATTGIYRSEYKSEQLDFYNISNDKVANDAAPFVVSKFEPSPIGKILEQGGVGAEFQPTASNPHTSKAAYSYNTGATSSEAEEVREFNSDGTSTGFYAANTLSRNETTDPDGNKMISFTDGTGKTIVTKQQSAAAGYLQTYYIYDGFDRIRYIVSPKGVNELRTNGWSLAPILNQYVHQFVYDGLGRLVEKKVPGKEWEYFVYDKYNRLVLTQDGILRGNKQWTFQKYDLYGRTVMQGLYTNAVDTTRGQMETLVNGLYKISNATYPASARYEDRGTTLHGYTNVSFPQINHNASALTVTQVNYYDTYDFDFNGAPDFSYTPQALSGEGTAPQGSSEGMPTGTKTLVLGGGTTYLTAYVFYDSKGRFIQKRSNSLMNSVIDNLSTVTYDFEGKVIASRGYNRHAPDKVNRNVYDAQGRLTAIYGPAPVAEPVQWTAGTNVTVTGSDVQKTAGVANTWDAGTISTNFLAANADGWVEFKAGETTSHKTIGLSANNASVRDNSINFGIRMANNGTLAIYENGVHMGAVGPYNVNDILSVERRNGKIYYRKNFEVIHESAVSSTGALYIDCALFTTNASVKNVTLSRSQEFKIAQYEYNELGQLVDKKLHNTSGSDFLQSVDYRYNIRGQLTSINNAPLTNDGDLNDETTDHFGLETMYHTTDAGLSNTPYYNGNISAIKWKGAGQASGNADQRSYLYTYDKANRLENAVSKMNSGSAWNKEVNAFNEAMTYDHNGNILTLKRNGRAYQAFDTYGKQNIDSLTYGYEAAMGDRLKNVEDLSGVAAGFKNTVNTAGTNEYVYDVNGNLYSDVNKGILSISYNHLNLPTVINFSGGKKIEYTYNASGTKLRMRTLQGSTVLTTTDYVESYVYEDGILKYFGSPEGRTVMNGNKPEYQYAIADHQGNTRVVFTSAAPVVQTPSTGFESDPGTLENFPAGGNRSPLPLFNQTAGGTYSQLLNGGNNSQVGVAKSFAVYPGDKVKILAYAKYEAGGSSANTGFATALLQAFTLPAPGVGETGTSSSALNAWGGLIDEGIQEEGTAPQAFVNIVVFDKDYNLLDAAWDQVDAAAEQVGVSPDIAHDEMLKEYTIKEAGFVYLYVSNNSPVNVYFDDVTITHTPTNVIQYNEYYPFGLQASTSWTREGNKNDFLYNAGSELNVTSGWYDLFFRNYDPALGRFMQVDPLATSTHNVGAYNYANNNPIAFNDPNGALPVPQEQLEAMFAAQAMSVAAAYNYWSRDGFGGSSSGRGALGGGGGSGFLTYEDVKLRSWARTGDPDAMKEYADKFGTQYEQYDVFMDYKMSDGSTASDFMGNVWKPKDDGAGPGGPNQLLIYSPDQIRRIQGAANDGAALNIAAYGLGNQFVDGNGNPSNYAERSFNKKHPNSKISFPGNGHSGRFVPGTNGDMQIMGLNYETGQFEQLRLVPFKTNAELIDGVLQVIFETGVDEIIDHIYNLPPIILPPGYFNTQPGGLSPDRRKG